MLQEQINKLLIHINEKEEKKDYDLNEIVREFSEILSLCKSQEEIEILKKSCIKIKGNSSIGNFLYNDFVQKVNEKEIELIQKKDKIASIGDKTKVSTKEKSKLYKKNGSLILDSEYMNKSGIEFDTFELRTSCSHLQFGLAILEAQNKDEDIKSFYEEFLKYIDGVLIECKNHEDIQKVKQLLEDMSKLGNAGKIAYEQFIDKISLKEKVNAIARKKEREERTQKNESYEIDRLLEEYKDAYGKNMIDTDELRMIYNKGQVMLARGKVSGTGVMDKLKRLQEYQTNTKGIVESLDEDIFNDL